MKHFSPAADLTLAYGSELLTLDAATVIGKRAAGRLARRMPPGAPVARIAAIVAMRAFLRRVGSAIVPVILRGGTW